MTRDDAPTPAVEPRTAADSPGMDSDATGPDYAALERLARAATPGPWEHVPATSYGVSNRTRNVGPMVTGVTPQSVGGGVMQFRGSPQTEDADAAYIAAASPDVVLRRLARRAPGDRGLREALEAIADWAAGSHESCESGYPDCPAIVARAALAADSRPEE